MPDSGVDVSIYRNQPDPLGTASKVFGLVNTAQQNQLLQQAQQIRNFEARQQQAYEPQSAPWPIVQALRVRKSLQQRLSGPGKFSQCREYSRKR
jgi:hypothetical protein